MITIAALSFLKFFRSSGIICESEYTFSKGTFERLRSNIFSLILPIISNSLSGSSTTPLTILILPEYESDMALAISRPRLLCLPLSYATINLDNSSSNFFLTLTPIMSHVESENNFLLLRKNEKSTSIVLISCSSAVERIASVRSCANLTKNLMRSEP